jgi:hypothetical protein
MNQLEVQPPAQVHQSHYSEDECPVCLEVVAKSSMYDICGCNHSICEKCVCKIRDTKGHFINYSGEISVKLIKYPMCRTFEKMSVPRLHKIAVDWKKKARAFELEMLASRQPQTTVAGSPQQSTIIRRTEQPAVHIIPTPLRRPVRERPVKCSGHNRGCNRMTVRKCKSCRMNKCCTYCYVCSECPTPWWWDDYLLRNT